jgi:hypothetical protein
MATKENMTSQRGMLKSIHSKINTLASILFESLNHVGVYVSMLFCLFVCFVGEQVARISSRRTPW